MALNLLCTLALLMLIVSGLRVACASAPGPTDRIATRALWLALLETLAWVLSAPALAALAVRGASPSLWAVPALVLGSLGLIATFTVTTALALRRFARRAADAEARLATRIKDGAAEDELPARLAQAEVHRLRSATLRKRAVRTRGRTVIALAAGLLSLAATEALKAQHGIPGTLFVGAGAAFIVLLVPLYQAQRSRLWWDLPPRRRSYAGDGELYNEQLNAYIPLSVQAAVAISAALVLTVAQTSPDGHKMAALGIALVLLSGLVAFEDLAEPQWSSGLGRWLDGVGTQRLRDALRKNLLRAGELLAVAAVLAFSVGVAANPLPAWSDGMEYGVPVGLYSGILAAAAYWTGDQLPVVVSNRPAPQVRADIWKASEPRRALLGVAMILFVGGNLLLLVREYL